MTDNAPGTSSASDATESAVGQGAADAVREILESGSDVRERVRALVVDLFRGEQTAGTAARSAIQGIYDTAADVVRRSAPAQPDSVLRPVIDGVVSGLQAVAQSTQYALQEAAARGQRFSGDDLDYAARNVNAAGDALVDTVRYASERFGAELGAGTRELKIHAERAVETVRPAISASLEAITQHPLQTATEAAGSTLRGGRLAAGAFLGALSGVLAGAAELLDPQKGNKQ